jgi:CubicO group peptidase (beta-lactamase class C family)
MVIMLSKYYCLFVNFSIYCAQMIKFRRIAASIATAVFIFSLAPSASAAVPVCRTHSQFSAVVALDGRVLCQPSNPNVRYGVASMSKMITALTVVQLSETIDPKTRKPYVSLDAPLLPQLRGKYKNGPDSRWKSVTPRQLLNHTSGIKVHYDWFFNQYQSTRFTAGWRSIAWSLPTQWLDRTPGSGYKYSNANFVMLGHLAEAVTGRKFQDLVDEHVLKPLKLSTYQVNFAADNGLAGGYQHPYYYQWKYKALGPAGGFTATPAAMATIISGYYSLLNRSTRITQWSGNKAYTPYGFGMMHFGSSYVGHTGTIAGVRTAGNCNVYVNGGRCSAILYNGYGYTSGSEFKYPSFELDRRY